MPSLEEKFILKAPFNASATTRKLQQDVENFVLYITEILFQKVLDINEHSVKKNGGREVMI